MHRAWHLEAGASSGLKHAPALGYIWSVGAGRTKQRAPACASRACLGLATSQTALRRVSESAFICLCCPALPKPVPKVLPSRRRPASLAPLPPVSASHRLDSEALPPSSSPPAPTKKSLSLRAAEPKLLPARPQAPSPPSQGKVHRLLHAKRRRQGLAALTAHHLSSPRSPSTRLTPSNKPSAVYRSAACRPRPSRPVAPVFPSFPPPCPLPHLAPHPSTTSSCASPAPTTAPVLTAPTRPESALLQDAQDHNAPPSLPHPSPPPPPRCAIREPPSVLLPRPSVSPAAAAAISHHGHLHEHQQRGCRAEEAEPGD